MKERRTPSLPCSLRVFGSVVLTASLLSCATPPTTHDDNRPTLTLLLRIPGEAAGGELGFRFGPPRDTNDDGIDDIAAGARFTDLEFTHMGCVNLWSSADGTELAHWEGHTEDALFGHAVILGPDVDGDGAADVIAAAPNGKYHGVYRGVLYARSSASRRLLWNVLGVAKEGLGWDMALAGDQDGDGTEDLFAASPEGGQPGKVYLLSGRDGSTLQTFASGLEGDQFGWYVANVPDLDGDGRPDLLVGAPSSATCGAAYAFSTATGRRLHVWRGTRPGSMFGEVVAGVDDLDGDGVGDVVVGAPSRATGKETNWPAGEVFVFSGASGRQLYHWFGLHERDLYGRMVKTAGDADQDGVGDIAIGSPWYQNGNREKAGRVEVRSGRTGELLCAVTGERAEMWLGWHVEAAENLGSERKAGLVVSALRSEENGLAGAGALHVFLWTLP